MGDRQFTRGLLVGGLLLAAHHQQRVGLADDIAVSTLLVELPEEETHRVDAWAAESTMRSPTERSRWSTASRSSADVEPPTLKTTSTAPPSTAVSDGRGEVIVDKINRAVQPQVSPGEVVCDDAEGEPKKGDDDRDRRQHARARPQRRRGVRGRTRGRAPRTRRTRHPSWGCRRYHSGALVAAAYAAGVSQEAIERAALAFRWSSIARMSLMPRLGLLDSGALTDAIHRILGDDPLIEELPGASRPSRPTCGHVKRW